MDRPGVLGQRINKFTAHLQDGGSRVKSTPAREGEVEMAEPKLEIVKPAASDTSDLSDLWLDPALGDGLTDVHANNVPIGKPKDFFRVHPDKSYRRRAEIYTHKPEGQIEQQSFILAKPMMGRLPEARACTIVTCVYRDGSPRLWVLPAPKDNEKDNDAWRSARAAARDAMSEWVRIVWVRRSYQVRRALPGYAPEPDWGKLPPFDELVTLAFGDHGIMRDTNHSIYRQLVGVPPEDTDDGDDL
jgi:hypothetical protein